MITDGDIEELHAFAKKIGLKREWFQEHPTHPHYDIRGARKRMLAVWNDAIQLDTLEFGKKLKEIHAKQSTIPTD